MRSIPVLASLLSTVALPVAADVPNVVADIGPVHGLVSRVMEGIGEPELVIPRASSVHTYEMRPSQAAMLENADIVFWIGEELTPWFEKPVETLAQDAVTVALLDSEGTHVLEFREDEGFEHDDHDEHGDHDEHEGHDDHDEHDDHEDHEDHAEHEEHGNHDEHHDEHEEHASHEDHEDHDDHEGHDDHDDHDHEAEHHDDHEGHDHHGADPHAWLDPENGAIWLDVIAGVLAEADPENADAYFANAAAGQAEIEEAVATVETMLGDADHIHYAVNHDAYQYFETEFGLTPVGAITLGDAAAPGPARIAHLKEQLEQTGTHCLLLEPQQNSALAEAMADDDELKLVEIDPLGAEIPLGSGFYTGLLVSLAGSFAECH